MQSALAQPLVINGQDMLLARDAARLSGFTSSYIAMLCRAGRLHALQLPIGWLVSHSSLQQFLEQREQEKARQRAELKAQRKAEYARHRGETPSNV